MTRRTPPTPTWRRWTAVPPAAAPARLHPAAAARRRLYLGARLLEPEPQRLLLGAGRLGAGAVYRRAVDAGLLGFRGRHLSVARRLLGPHIGFYGGINYGFGYIGIGFVGGYWNHDRYFYNRAVTNVNVTHITNVYTHNVVVNNIDNRRISYNGGPNGIRRMADPREAAALNEAHIPPTAAQLFARSAGADRGQFFEHNQGRPPPRLHGARPRAGRRLPARWRTESRRRPARRSPQRFRLAQHQHRAASGPEPRRPRPAPERARRAAAGPRGAASSPAGPGAAAGSRTGPAPHAAAGTRSRQSGAAHAQRTAARPQMEAPRAQPASAPQESASAAAAA